MGGGASSSSLVLSRGIQLDKSYKYTSVNTHCVRAEWGGAESIWLGCEGQLELVHGKFMKMDKVTALSMALVSNMGFPKL